MKSYRPQLVAASNIALFFPIFLLTSRQNVSGVRNKGFFIVSRSEAKNQVTSHDFLDAFFVALFAAACALLPTLLLPRRTAARQVPTALSLTTNTICDLLPLSLSSVLEIEDGHEETIADVVSDEETGKVQPSIGNKAKQGALAKTLKANLATLQAAYNAYRREFTRKRLSTRSFVPVIETIHRIGRNPLLGPTSHVPGERIKAALTRTYERRSRTPSIAGTPNLPRRYGDPSIQSRSRSSAIVGPANTGAASPDLLRAALTEVMQERGRLRSPSMASLPKPTSDGIMASSNQVVDCLKVALRVSDAELHRIFSWSTSNSDEKTELVDIRIAKSDLDFALSQLQRQLSTLLDGVPAYSKPKPKSSTRNFLTSMKFELFNEPSSPAPSSIKASSAHGRDHFRLAFYMTALVDLAKDVQELLLVVTNLQTTAASPIRWWLPEVEWPILSHFRPSTPPDATEASGGRTGELCYLVLQADQCSPHR